MDKPKKDKVNIKHYLWSLQFMKPYIHWVFLLCFSGIIVAICELVIPKFIQYFIDVVATKKDMTSFVNGVILIILVLIIKFAGNAAKEYFQRVVQENAARDLQISIFSKLRQLGFSYYENTPTGYILTLLNSEVAALQKIYRHYFPELIRHGIFVGISFGFMISLNITLTIIFLCCFLIYYIVGPYFEKRTSWAEQELTNSQLRFGQKIYESIASVAELRAFFAQSWDAGRVINEVDQLNKFYILRYWYVFCRAALRRLSYYFASIALFLYGFYAVKMNILTIGEFIAYLLYYFNALRSLTLLVTLTTEQNILLYQVKNLYNFMHISPEIHESKNSTKLDLLKGEITFKNVIFSYSNQEPVIQNLSLTIKPGEKIALVGKSGCGKSSLLKLIGRFYDTESGTIFVDGVPIQNLSFSFLRKNITFVFQDTYLFGSTIYENIRFARPEATYEEVVNAAKDAQMHESIITLSDGYDTIVGERGVKLSGGQKQRIALARMFLRKTQIIVLDEPTSALDNITEKMILDSISEKLNDSTIITVAHRISTIRNYDQIVVMDSGKIIEVGTYADLINNKDAFYRLTCLEVNKEAYNA
ncbi:ABC transporter ATP-binding protein [Brevibacillus reuszeri]|uniref:ABC transporter ATP-binding protein n=1 Tax=Brevibacillus reuszeri TaxID=54915 RepID=UPI003D1DEB23